MILYHEKSSSTRAIERFDSFFAYVEKETLTGCILSLQLEGGTTAPAFAFGSFNKGDMLLVSINKLFDDGRYPRVSVDSVISYSDNTAKNKNVAYAA
ncbi:MAG: hypothetical protein IKT38_01860 [Clostridia bacterium]|nr:hypothetical protein [Clostridia bacterium]